MCVVGILYKIIKRLRSQICHNILMDNCTDGITGTETHDGWKAKPVAVVVVVDGRKQLPAKYSCKSVSLVVLLVY
jgi:hypothetical protein